MCIYIYIYTYTYTHIWNYPYLWIIIFICWGRSPASHISYIENSCIGHVGQTRQLDDTVSRRLEERVEGCTATAAALICTQDVASCHLATVSLKRIIEASYLSDQTFHYIHIYIYMHMCIYIYIFIYTYMKLSLFMNNYIYLLGSFAGITHIIYRE